MPKSGTKAETCRPCSAYQEGNGEVSALFGSYDSPLIEALIDGTWTDISTRVRGEQKVVISRGRANEQSRTPAQSARLTLDNTDAFFSNRDPSSVNYGLIPRNTQLRVSAGTSTRNYVYQPYNDQNDATYVNTADKAVLDITGDIDIRVEVWPHTWRPGIAMVLASKWNTPSNLSWVFFVNTDGKLYVEWSTGGTSATIQQVGSTIAMPQSTGRIALRCTIDVDNGAAGKDIKFFTATDIGASYTQFGSTVTTAGTSSIFSGAANLVAGGTDFSNGSIPFGGKFYAFELRNGINGTLVADMDATAKTLSTTSWSDGLSTPNTWNVQGAARIVNDRVRFWGELASLPRKGDSTGVDLYIPATASGTIRRLTQGASPLRSPMYRNFTQYTPHGYWPLEDGSDSTMAASAVSNGTAATASGVSFGATSGLPGASKVIAFNSATGQILGFTNPVAGTGTVSFVFYVKLSALPASGTPSLVTLICTGATASRIEIALNATTWRIDFYNNAGTNLGGSSTLNTDINPAGQWVGYNLLLETSGSDMTYSQRWDVAGDFAGGTGPDTISSATVKPITKFTARATNDAAYADAQLSHFFMSTQALNLVDSNFRQASIAYLGETAAARMDRMLSEESIPFEIIGFYSDTAAMGYQSIGTLMDNIYECWDADGGIGGDLRNALSIGYRTRVDLERRSDITLVYTDSHLSEVPESTDDDQGFANDVTVSRKNGSSARVTIDEGPTSVSSPPDGVGAYPVDITLNLGDDSAVPDAAGWIALVQSWDSDRFPAVTAGMHRSELLNDSTIFSEVASLNLGDTLVLNDLPSWMSPDDVPEIVQGYTETLSKFMWNLKFNCTPAGAYQSVGVLDDDSFQPRTDGTTHSIGSDVTTTGTSISLVTDAGSEIWVDSTNYPDEFPFDVIIGGEVMTMTAISGSSSPQAGTVTRSVNGVVKAHSAGDLVRLAVPYYLGR